MSAQPPTPADRERDPVATLLEYGLLGEADPALVRFTELAAEVCGVPSAVLDLIDGQHRQRLAAFGFEPVLSDQTDSMWEAALRDGGQLVVPDASADPRFEADPWVTGELGSIRFYAASPLRTPDGQLLGTLCAFDSEPGTLTEGQRRALATVALSVIDALELSRRGRQLERLGTVAAQLSHDLKTPLTASLGFGELLQDHPAVREDATALDYVNRLVSASQRMMAAIERLLG
jgi:GAF domain-containing protein